MIYDNVSNLRTDKETLDKLLEAARNIKITPEMLFEQRVSFVYGQLGFSSNITKDQVRRMLLDEDLMARVANMSFVPGSGQA